ncbi:hypothetical protein M885DRAFT_430602 [Pelagophyceae sp. CCMP2097]|nr:hypothetical protein M885DRAFT_430602 [Pelagophyceae sp. CCMP2097]
MSRRVREEILERVVYGDNANEAWFADAKPALDALALELKNTAETPLALLVDDGGADVAAWNDLLKRHAGETWLSAPWFIAEFYLYRRVASATKWFAAPEGLMPDVFAKAKAAGLASAAGALEGVAQRCSSLMKDPNASELFVSVALWGNRMDLSLWPAGANVVDSFSEVLDAAQAQLLADDTPQALQLLDALRAQGGGVVDLVVDNAGFELCTDLLLAAHLLESGAASQVRLRVKHHPTFVSDALEQDVDGHISTLAADAAHPAAAALAAKWRVLRNDGRLVCVNDSYWAMPYALWEMPASLRSEFQATSKLTIVKGDANYRRALGDRAWPLSTPFSDIVSYWPSPMLCLRTLKAEVGCGMPDSETQRAAAADAQWLTNGRWGVVHFAPKAANV